MKIVFNDGDVYGILLHKVELLCIGLALSTHSTTSMQTLLKESKIVGSVGDIKLAFNGPLTFAENAEGWACTPNGWPSAPYSTYACIHEAAKKKLAGLPVC